MRFASPHRSGFSLVELMIAIMILGLGMVMVATVFPVSLDLTRSTLQINIGAAAFEAAVATLQQRVPSRYTSFEPYPPDNTAEVVLWPNVAAIELATGAIINKQEHRVDHAGEEAGLGVMARLAFNDILWALPLAPAGGPSVFTSTWPANKSDFLRLSRPYTEQTYWDAEMHGTFRNIAWVVPSVNVLATGGAPVVEAYPAATAYKYSVPYIQNPDFNTSQTPIPRAPRIHLADRVYPPIGLQAEPSGSYYDPSTADPTTGAMLPFTNWAQVHAYVAQASRERRYAWTAFASQGGNTLEEFKLGKRTFMCTIALMYRGDLNARYARQEQPTDDGQFNFTDNTDSDFKSDFDLMRLARPDTVLGAGSDTVFPQPWLVMLDNVNPSAGTVTCSAHIARLLPTNSYLIVAQKNGTLQAGAPLKITDAPSQILLTATDPYTLQVARFNGGLVQNVAVWVFPPAINPDRKTFQGNSPVVGVAVREVTPDWGK